MSSILAGILHRNILTVEHLLIGRMINLIHRELERIGQGKEADWLFVDGALDFAKTYADACHHGKVEGILFETLGMKRLIGEHRCWPSNGVPLTSSEVEIFNLTHNSELPNRDHPLS